MNKKWNHNSVQDYDVIIIGLGAMGSSVLYHLNRLGHGMRILGIDKHHPPHDKGSSHGGSRLTRLATAEGAKYVGLAKRSLEIIQKMEHKARRKFYYPGGLLIGPTESDFIDNTRKLAESFQIQHQMLDESQLRERYPMMKDLDYESGYFEPTMGALDPEGIIRYQIEASDRAGTAVLTNCKVSTDLIRDNKGRYVVESKGERYRAPRVVVTAGAWGRQFLAKQDKVNLFVKRATQFYFKVSEGHRFAYRLENFPSTVRIVDEGLATLLIPDLKETGVVKLAPWPFHLDQSGLKDPGDVAPIDEREIEDAFERFIEPYYEGVLPDCVEAHTCLFTLAPKHDFIIDEPHDGVSFVSACSGHGFKHSPAIGESLAEHVLGRKPHFDLFSLFGGYFNGS